MSTKKDEIDCYFLILWVVLHFVSFCWMKIDNKPNRWRLQQHINIDEWTIRMKDETGNYNFFLLNKIRFGRWIYSTKRIVWVFSNIQYFKFGKSKNRKDDFADFFDLFYITSISLYDRWLNLHSACLKIYYHKNICSLSV